MLINIRVLIILMSFLFISKKGEIMRLIGTIREIAYVGCFTVKTIIENKDGVFLVKWDKERFNHNEGDNVRIELNASVISKKINDNEYLYQIFKVNKEY